MTKDHENIPKEFTIVAVGLEYTMFNIGKCKGLDSAMVFESLPDKSGYAMNIYLADMLPEEMEILRTQPMVCRVVKQSKELVLPLVRFGNSPLLFEIIFDPTIYKDMRSMQLVSSNHMVQVVGVDSNTNIVHAIRYCNMPKQLKEMWVSSWHYAFEDPEWSERYTKWTQDLAMRYPLDKLWDAATYVGKFGES